MPSPRVLQPVFVNTPTAHGSCFPVPSVLRMLQETTHRPMLPFWPSRLCRWFLQTAASTCAAAQSAPVLSALSPASLTRSPICPPPHLDLSLSQRHLYHPWFVISLCLLGPHHRVLLALLSESGENKQSYIGSQRGPHSCFLVAG